MRWTAKDIPELSGRRAVVTGANGGVGFEVARELARAGAEVVLACRNPERGEAALARIGRDLPGAGVGLETLDLASLASVRDFAHRLGPAPVDLLINNAGVMAPPRRVTVDGFELQFATNHLGHFALTGLVLNRLRAAPAARVVSVSSLLHRRGRIDFDDLQREHDYRRWAAYSQSKLANLLFCFELDRRSRTAGLDLASVAAHPGYAATGLQASGPSRRIDRLVFPVGNLLFAQSAAAGALPVLFAACAPGLPSGAYIGPDGPGERRGHPRVVAPSPAALDPEIAARLWEVSAELTGVTWLAPARSA